MPRSNRLSILAARDSQGAALVERLLGVSVRLLPHAYVDGEFAFTMTGVQGPNGDWQVRRSGLSIRYTAITALGLRGLGEQQQWAVLAGETFHDLVGRLAKRLGDTTNLGDAALVCWAAAYAGHSDLPYAVECLAALDRNDSSVDVVAAAWVVSALVAARAQLDVEEHLHAARQRLLTARSRTLYPHSTSQSGPWYRAHVGSFADQVYPVQALARLHSSADDPEALDVANTVVATICAAQGDAGQWWWHYDSRTGRIVEEYPVYSVHQHSMAPMALLDLADAGGEAHLDAISHGLRWLISRPESSENLVLEQPQITWRKVARGDRHKMVRGARAISTRLNPRMRLQTFDRLYPPGVVDHECRPYELGWLLLTWL